MDELGHILAQGVRLVGYAVLAVACFYAGLMLLVVLGGMFAR